MTVASLPVEGKDLQNCTPPLQKRKWMQLGTGSHSQQMFRGGAGASRPRSTENTSSGPPVKMAPKGANLATLGKKQKDSLFLCKSRPCRIQVCGAPVFSHRGGAGGSTSPSFLSSLLLVPFSFVFPSVSTFFFSKQIHFLVIKAHLFGLLPALAFDF